MPFVSAFVSHSSLPQKNCGGMRALIFFPLCAWASFRMLVDRLPGMKSAVFALIFAMLASGQAKLPPDVDKDSLSRFPLLKRTDMKDDYERKIFDTVHGERTTPFLGPGGISLHSPHIAESMNLFNEHLRYKNLVGRPLTETAILVTAREIDQAYEWNSHEATARMVGVDPKVIDVIKNFKDAKALPERERAIVDWGRALFRGNHQIGSAQFAAMVKIFGRNGMYEVTSVMSDYLFAGIILHAANQQRLPDFKYDLPVRKIPAVGKVAAAPPAASGSTPGPLPADIDKETYSRLPALKCADFMGRDREVCQTVAGPNRATPGNGPGAVSIYSIPVAEAMNLLNQYLGRSPLLGRRVFQLASVIGSREFDQQYEYSSHEPAALSAGVAQSTIDIIKFNKPIEGIADEKDDTLVRVGRQLFQEHKLDAALWAKLEKLLGRQGAMEAVAAMADYAMVGLMLNAVNQQLPPDRPALMPMRQ
jgi:4-carboxymuconolactone decarboxylase